MPAQLDWLPRLHQTLGLDQSTCFPMPAPTVQALICHPDTPPAFACEIRVEVMPLPGGNLSLRYRLRADPARLRIPAQSPASGRVDGLWRHTCCELFLAEPAGTGYREFNFSPSGLWHAYIFSAYRDGGPLEPVSAPSIRVDTRTDGLDLSVLLPAAAPAPDTRCRLGLSVVLETADGALSYWALRHAPGKPDFHHPDTFALEIDLRNPQP